MTKVHIVLVDGMRPDAVISCSNPYAKELIAKSLSTMEARTVMPSVTLPCHMSLFHSVDPGRHGVTTNTFTPQVRPIDGIVEQIRPRTSAMFYNWEALTDLNRPGGKMMTKQFFSGSIYGYEKACELTVKASIDFINSNKPDFCFTYIGWPDEEGHAYGWMGEKYMHSVDVAFSQIKDIIESTPDEYMTIVIADHGGHERSHGTEMNEDMLIPVIIYGKDISPGVFDRPVSIKDIAPTVAKVLGCESAPEWEGTSLL